MNNKLNKVFKVFFSVLLAVILSVSGVITSFADTIGTENKAKRTIMVYMDGSSSEENNPVCSAMLEEYMNAKFDRNYIRIIIMTGGSMKWHLDSKYLRDQDGNSGTLNEISNEYNQIWEVFGTTDDSEGYLKLLDADGVTGDGADARKSEDELMSNPETLKEFINYARNYAPAERYGLILNDHGSGPEHGYGYDNHDTVNPDAVISVTGLKLSIFESDVVQKEGKFDFIDLDCCMMGNFETMLALSDYTDYYLGSPDIAPHATVDYTAVINYLSTDPDMETEKLGRKIVDLYVDFYEEHPELRSAGKAVCYTLVDTKALKESGFIEEMLKLAKQLRTEAADGTFYDEIRASKEDYKYAITSLQDLATLVEQLGISIYESDWQDPSLENAYTESALKIQNILHNKEIVYSKHTKYSRETSVFFGRDDDGSIKARVENAPTSGLNIFFVNNPASGDCAKELSFYIDAMKELAAVTENKTEKELINTYLQAIIDYDLIYNTGIAVTNLEDNGCDINEINFNKVKEYFESQAENNRWNYISKSVSSSDRDVEAWLNKIIDIQKNEVLSRENISAKTESRDKTEYYRVNIKETPKRIIDIPVLKVTAKTDNYPFHNPTVKFYGNKSDDESFEDYLSNVNSSYIIPKYDGQWYAVEDSEGVKHIASKASDQSVYAMFTLNGKELGVGELLFDEAGNAKGIYIYGNTIPISLDSLEGTVMVSLCNNPYEGSNAPVDMPFMLEKTNARLIKDNYSNLGIENIDIKLAITDIYSVEHEIKPTEGEISVKDTTAHIYSMEDTETMQCLFKSSMPDMAFISTVDFLKHIYVDEPTEEKNADGTYTITNPKGTMVIDPENDTIHFDSFEDFISAKENAEGTELDAPYIREYAPINEGEVNGLDLDLSPYKIDVIEYDGKTYFPVSSIGLLFSETYNTAVYDKDNVYFIHTSDIVMGTCYFQNTTVYDSLERSKDLVELSYNDLCFAVDKLYGRPAQAELAAMLEGKSFDETLDEYSDETRRAKELLLSESTIDYVLGTAYLGQVFSDGGHTALDYPAVLAFLTPGTAVYDELDKLSESEDFRDKKAVYYTMSSLNFGQESKTMSELRSGKYKDYDLVKSWDDKSASQLLVTGDTAVFAFDMFVNEAVYNFKWSLDYAKEKGIKRFVIDLSCNSGGSAAVVMYIMAMITNQDKDSYTASYRKIQTLTGNITRVDHDMDLNLDGEINDLDKSVYYDFEYAFITSNISYSCGNLLPCLAKDAGFPILGERSGGGACSLLIAYTPETFFYTMSSYNKFITADGNDVDSGAELDYDLTKRVTDDEGNETIDYSGLYDLEDISSKIDEYYGVTSEPSEEPSESSSQQSNVVPDGNDVPATGDYGFAAVFAFLTVIAAGAVIYLDAVSKKKERS